MTLTWKKQTFTIEHRGIVEQIVATDEAIGLLVRGRLDLVSVQTLQPIARVEVGGNVNFRRHAQLVLDNDRIATLGAAGVATREIERIDTAGRVLAVDGERVLVEGEDALYLVGSGSGAAIRLPAHPSLRGGVQADISGRHVVLGNHEGVRAYVVDGSAESVEINGPPGFQHDFSMSLAVRGDVLFVYAPKDGIAGQGTDPPEGASGGSPGALLVYGFEAGAWRFRHRIKATVKQTDPYGRFFMAGPGLLAIPRQDKKLDVFEVSPQGDVSLSKVFAKGHYWQAAAVTSNTIIVPNGKPSSVDVWRGQPKAAKSGKPKKASAPALSEVVRHLPEVGRIDDALVHLKKLATQCSSRRTFTELCKKAKTAWETNARQFEAALPELDAAMGELDDGARSISHVFHYPDAPGWIGLARSAHFDSTYGDPKGGYAEMGRCPLPPHFRRLTIEHAKLRGNHVEAMLAGAYLRELAVLVLTGRIGDKGAKAIARTELPRLRALHLHNNEIGAGGVRALCSSKALPGLQRLDLRHNSIRSSSTKLHGAFEGSEGLQLRELGVHGCSLRDDDLQGIVERGAKLESLDLRGNSLSADAYELVASLPALREVRIGLATPPPEGFASRLVALEVGDYNATWSEAMLESLLADAGKLERLVLHGSIESIVPLTRATGLCELLLDGVPDGVSLEPLADLPALRVFGAGDPASVAPRIPDALRLERPAKEYPPTQGPWVPEAPSTWKRR